MRCRLLDLLGRGFGLDEDCFWAAMSGHCRLR